MGRRRVTIQYSDGWEAVVEVSEGAVSKMEEVLEFWGVSISRLNDKEVERSYLQMLGHTLITKSMSYSAEGIIKDSLTWEGWYPLDGSGGVKLISVDMFEIYWDEFDILG